MRCPAFIPVVYPDGRNRRDGGRLVAVAEGYRAWRGLLSSDDASLVAYLELTIQPLQDFHRRPGIAGAFRRRQQLECPQLEPHRVVPVHLPAVLETQNLLIDNN